MNSIFQEEYPLNITIEKCLNAGIHVKHIVNLIEGSFDPNSQREENSEYFFEIIRENYNRLWFSIICHSRYDIIETFLMYGIQDYTEYRTFDNFNSFGWLIEIGFYNICVKSKDFIKFFHLFMSAGIPTDNVDPRGNNVAQFIRYKMQKKIINRFHRIMNETEIELYIEKMDRENTRKFSLSRDFFNNRGENITEEQCLGYGQAIFDCFPTEFEEVGITA